MAAPTWPSWPTAPSGNRKRCASSCAAPLRLRARSWPRWLTTPTTPYITDREGDLLYLERDHRRHAECEGAIRDLKYGVSLNHFPSVNFGANAAWLQIQALSHNILRWLTRIGDPYQGVLTAATVRRRIIAVPGRITRSGRRNMLHLPRNWPWAGMFNRILGGVKAKPAPV